MTKYYVLEHNTFEGLSLQLPTEQFHESCHEVQELGEEPFAYSTLEEAKQVRNALDLIFKKKFKSRKFIIVQEIV